MTKLRRLSVDKQRALSDRHWKYHFTNCQNILVLNDIPLISSGQVPGMITDIFEFPKLFATSGNLIRLMSEDR